MQITRFDTLYAEKLSTILNQSPAMNKRTGKMVRAVHGVCLNVPQGVFPIVALRDINPLWSCAEAVWFMSGRNDLRFMHDFGFKSWDKFADASGNVQSGAGFRWRRRFKADQLVVAVAKLKQDSTNRQAVLLSWDPESDNIDVGPNVPGVMIWHIHILNNALHMSVLQRSADMYFGLPHDILGSRIIQELIAGKLGVATGGMMYSISNAHLYEDQWSSAEEMVFRAVKYGGEVSNGVPSLNLGQMHFDNALDGDKLLAHYINSVIQATYRPGPKIAGPKLTA